MFFSSSFASVLLVYCCGFSLNSVGCCFICSSSSVIIIIIISSSSSSSKSITIFLLLLLFSPLLLLYYIHMNVTITVNITVVVTNSILVTLWSVLHLNETILPVIMALVHIDLHRGQMAEIL